VQVLNPKIAFPTLTRNQSVDRGRLWELSSDLLGILNADGYFESTNPAWTTALGWKSESILATSIFDLIHPDDVEKTRISFKDAEAKADGVLHFENRYRGPTVSIDGCRGPRCRKRVNSIAAAAM
jgi:PAS domain-containing protein